MSKPFSIFLLAVAGVLIAVLVYHSSRSKAPVPANTTNPVVTASGKSNAAAITPSPGAEIARVLRLRRDQVLATVNGHAIKVGDLVPASGTNQEIEMSPVDLRFFLNRAVDRELIFETAQNRGSPWMIRKTSNSGTWRPCTTGLNRAESPS